jgi:hypothetical protein
VDFTQILIVNGDVVSEQHTGDYYPSWLRSQVTALFDLRAEEFSQAPKPAIKKERPEDLLSVPMNSTTGGGGSRGNSAPNSPAGAFMAMLNSTCQRWETRVGIAPVQNTVYTNVCLRGEQPKLLSTIDAPGFRVRFGDYKDFKGKLVARTVRLSLDSNAEVDALVTELSEWKSSDDSLFQSQPSVGDKDPNQSVRIEEPEARKMLATPTEINWAPVREGKATGVLSMIVYADKEGRVREIAQLTSDNRAVFAQARAEVSKWHFQPLKKDGAAVQMETILTLPFQTTVVNPLPVFPDEEARKMATYKSNSKFSSSKVTPGTAFTVRITVSEQGTVVGTENLSHTDETLFSLASSTLIAWRFKPYKVNGKPERFRADIVFHVE